MSAKSNKKVNKPLRPKSSANQNAGTSTGRRRKRKVQKRNNQKPVFYMSPCSRLYMKALLDPFAVQAGACIPDLLDMPSLKTLIISRGVFSAGTQGVGFVLCNPLANCNTLPQVVRTDVSYTQPDIQTQAPASVGVSRDLVPQMPYTDNNMTVDGINGRTVGVGVRARYIGTELNKSGQLIPVRPNYAFVNYDGNTVSSLLSRPEVPTLPCDRRWHSVTFLPTSSGDYSYRGRSWIDDNGQNANLGFVVQGAEIGNSWEFEIYWHQEYISMDGTIQPIGTTPSHSDVAGMSAIRNVVEGSLPIGDSKTAYAQALRAIQNVSFEEVSRVVGGTVQAGIPVMKSLGWI